MWERLGLALLHFVWQGLVVAAVVAVVTAYLPRGRQRYAAYLFGMAVMLACLPATFVSLRPASIAPLAEPGRVIAPPPVAPVSDHAEDRTVTPTPSHVPMAKQWIDPRHLPVTAVWAWLVGASLLSARLPLAWLAIRRLRTSATPAEDELRDRADALARTFGLRRTVGVMLSTRVVQPLVMGCLRPVILLPVSIATEMPLAMLDAVIAHELAHVRRWDLWVVYAQRLAETVLFYHPAVWWISARISGEREICCDDLAVAATGLRFEYAAALERAARHAFYGVDAAPTAALAFGADRHPTLERVRRVLGASPARPAWGWTSGVGAIGVMATLFAVGCGLARSRGNAAADGVKPQAAEATAGTVATKPRVLLVSDGDYFLQRAMKSMEWMQLDVVPPARYEARSAAGYDVVAFDGWLPAGKLPPVNTIFWGVSPPDLLPDDFVRTSGPFELKLPDHVLVRGLDLSSLVARNVRDVSLPPGAELVAASGDVPLLFTYQPDDRHTRVVVTFDHRESNWPARASFPVFVHNAMVLLTGHQHVAASGTAQPAPLNELERTLIGRWEPESDFAIPGVWSFTEDRRFDLIVSGSVLEAGTWAIADTRQLLVAVDRTADPKRAHTYTLMDVEQLDADTLVLRIGREGLEARRERYRRAAPTNAAQNKGTHRAIAAPPPSATRPAATTRQGARLIFRPTTTNSGETSWSGPIPNGPAGLGRAFILVTAHRGDRFPIRVRHDGPPLCHARIVDGDEHQIELELNDGVAPRRTVVKLNQPEKLSVGGHEITVSYGETTGQGDAPQYVDHATLFITFMDGDGDQVEFHKTLWLEPVEFEPAAQRSSGTSSRTSAMTTTTPTTSSRNP